MFTDNQPFSSLNSHLYKRSYLVVPLIIMFFSFLTPIQSSQQCIQYLQSLHNQSMANPIQFLHTMTPYLVLSGKSIDDLGFPGSCQQDEQRYKYFTVQVTIDTNTTQYTGYLGFCFTSMCNVEDLNGFAEFIIDFIFQEYKSGVTGKFVDPPLQLQFSGSALVICLIFTVIILIQMLHLLNHWLNLCKQPTDTQYAIKSHYIDLQNPNNQLQEDRLTDQSTVLQRISLKYKWNQLWKQQNSYHIWSFSIFRVLAVPLLLYSQIFWLTNYGAYNYYAFYQEIYQQFYVKIAIFGYYIPDIFFFISAFLFTKKILSFQDKDTQIIHLFKSVGKKFVRLYPLYIVVLIIYWVVSPTLHAGPIWYVYQQQAAVCNTTWWRVLLLIDNWFAQGCYPALWFVQAQLQYVLVISILFFPIYLKNKKAGLILLTLYMITSFVILFVFDAQMLVSVQIAIDPYTELYFKSFHSHLWFYLLGVFFAILAQKQSIRITLQQIILDRKAVKYTFNFIAVGILILIMLRPWVWSSSATSLKAQLSLCRIGTILCFIILFLHGMFVREMYTTVIHKYGYYMYPVILVSYMIAQSSFWSVGSFMYVSGTDIMNEMIPNFIISYTVGIFLGILFDFRSFMSKSS